MVTCGKCGRDFPVEDSNAFVGVVDGVAQASCAGRHEEGSLFFHVDANNECRIINEVYYQPPRRVLTPTEIQLFSYLGKERDAVAIDSARF